MKTKMKKLLALILAMAMSMSLIQPAFAMEDCGHFDLWWIDDDEGHYSECPDCFERLSDMEAHYDNDADGSCDVCGHPMDTGCPHLMDDWRPVDNEFHSRCCELCWDLETVEQGEHYDNDNDGKCDACEWTMEDEPTEEVPGGCQHMTPWCPGREDGHSYVCSDCNETIVDWEEHFDDNDDGKCDACEWPMEKEPETEPCKHVMSDWINDRTDSHSRACKLCWGENTVEREEHSFGEVNAYTCKCGFTNETLKNQVLGPVRSAAGETLDQEAAKYAICGDEMNRIINNAKNDINSADTEDAINAIVAEALENLPDAALIDAKIDALNQISTAASKLVQSQELADMVRQWITSIETADDFDAVAAALERILNDEIPAYDVEHPYVEPMSTVYSKIAGIYARDDNASIQLVVSKTADGEYQITIGGETLTIMDAFETETGIAVNTMYHEGKQDAAPYNFTFTGNTVLQQVGRNRHTLTKIANATPDRNIPKCQKCGAEMMLIETNEEGCTWTCDTIGCDVIAASNHVTSEVCPCTVSCLHVFDGDTCIKCDYVSEKRKLEALKADFKAYKDAAVEAADAMASDEYSAGVIQLIKDAKAAINAAEYDASLSAQQNNDRIDAILAQLSADIEAKIEAEQKPEVSCTTEKTIAPKSGCYALYLNGKYAGNFTFVSVTGGWAIQDAQGYLTVVNGALGHTDAPAAWAYKNNVFSITVTTKSSGILGWLFGTKSTTYYLTSASTVSTKSVKTELRETVSYTSHTFNSWVNQKNGSHKHTCSVCGEDEVQPCTYDEETGFCVCGAYDPARVSVKIDAVVEKVTKKYLIFFTKTSYRATISTKAEGTTVKTVEYSTNGGKTWTKGTSFTSDKAIESFKVRVTDNNGNVYTYTYPDDAVMLEVEE